MDSNACISLCHLQVKRAANVRRGAVLKDFDKSFVQFAIQMSVTFHVAVVACKALVDVTVKSQKVVNMLIT